MDSGHRHDTTSWRKKARKICKGCSIIPTDKSVVVEEMCFLKYSKKKNPRELFWNWYIRKHSKVHGHKDDIYRDSTAEKPTLPGNKKPIQQSKSQNSGMSELEKKLQKADVELVVMCGVLKKRKSLIDNLSKMTGRTCAKTWTWVNTKAVLLQEPVPYSQYSKLVRYSSAFQIWVYCLFLSDLEFAQCRKLRKWYLGLLYNNTTWRKLQLVFGTR